MSVFYNGLRHVSTPLKRTLVLLVLVLCVADCSVFRVSQYDSFSDWYIGPAGFDRTLEGPDLAGDLRRGIVDERPKIFGHLRLPELVFQPVGGISYPERRTQTTVSLWDCMGAAASAQNGISSSCTVEIRRESGANNALSFLFMDSGALDLMPYRLWMSRKGLWFKTWRTLLHPLLVIEWVPLTGVLRLPVYVTHDVLKTLMIPYAASRDWRDASAQPAEQP